MPKFDGPRKQEPAFNLPAIKKALVKLAFHPAKKSNDFVDDWSTFTKSNLPSVGFDTDPKLQTIFDRYFRIRGLDESLKYSEDQARALLAEPVTELDCLFNAEELEQLQKKMEPRSRLAIRLPRSEVSYSGPWHYQGFAPVCAAMSIANGAQAIGGSVAPEVFAKLLNLALPSGISRTTLAAVLSGHPNLNVRIVELPYESGLRAERKPLTADDEQSHLSFGKTFGDRRPAEERLQELRDLNAQEASKAVHNNATVIKEHLDRAEVLLVSLTRCLSAPEDSQSLTKPPLHAV